jgi:Bacterial aa3 type cytochrome c oxidase subunit IV
MNLDNVQGHPAMDYRAHLDTYRGFIRAAVWGCILLALLMALMAAFLV